MNNFDYRIGYLSGILKAFEWVNGKSNHGYSFTIEPLNGDESLEKLIENDLKTWDETTIVTATPLNNWREEFSKVLQSWLFSYVCIDENSFEDCLVESRKNASFTLFHQGFRDDFVSEFCDELEQLLKVSQALKIDVNMEKFYECAWHDFAFRGKNGSVFIHLGVSD